MRALKTRPSLCLLMLGLQAIVAQSLLLREASVLLFGSEVAWGVVLSAWLLGVALGGVAGGRLAARLRRSHTPIALAVAMLMLSVVSCLELWAFREARAWLGTGPGELVPLPSSALAAFVFVSPASSLVGMAFPLACRLMEPQKAKGHPPVGPLGRAYALESTGSLLGGVLFSFWAVEALTPIQIALCCGAVTAFASAGLLVMTRPTGGTSPSRIAGLALYLLGLAELLLALVTGDALHRHLTQRRWHHLAADHHLVSESDSRYQNLAVLKLHEQYTLFCDGQIAAHFPDPYAFGPLAHFWMCQHPAPRRVLVLGGGAEGLLSEVLLHPVKHVDYVEPDPRLIEIIEPHLTDSDRRALRDRRVTVHHEDARYFVKTARRQFDLVIARLPEPTSALRARLYTTEFFGELRRAMMPRSVLCMTASAAPGSLSAAASEYLASVRATLREHFAHITVGWGDPAQVVAATETGLTTTDPTELSVRYVRRSVRSQLFHPLWFEGATDWLEPDKIRKRSRELDRAHNVEISTDLRPVVYLQRLALWDRTTGGRAGHMMTRLRATASNVCVPAMGAALVLLVIFVTLVGSRLRRRSRPDKASATVSLSIGTTGFATMALSIVWLFAFQNLYGYVYQRIGWIIAVFMGGLVLGSAAVVWRSKGVNETQALRRLAGPSSSSFLLSYFGGRLIAVDLGLALLALAIPSILPALGSLQGHPLGLPLVEWAVSTMVALTGLLGGGAFALAGGMLLGAKGGTGRAAGTIVAADHAGACLGALLTGIYLVPVFGIAPTAYLLAAAKLVSAALIAGGTWRLRGAPRLSG